MAVAVSLMFPLYVSVCWYGASSLWSETRQYFIRTLIMRVLRSSNPTNVALFAAVIFNPTRGNPLQYTRGR